MLIDKKIIKQRKELYGDNFECIALFWNAFLLRYKGVEANLTGAEVAEMMVLMKECRIKAIQNKLGEVTNLKDIKKLEKALQDNETDKANYTYIARNYKEYKKL